MKEETPQPKPKKEKRADLGSEQKQPADRIGDLFKILAEDVDDIARPYWDKNGREIYPVTEYSPIKRRLIVRNVFAFIEGMIFQMKQVALLFEQETPGVLSSQEVALAKEKEYALNEKGEIEERTAKIRLKPNFLFAFKLFAKAGGLDEAPNLAGHSRWQDLGAAVTVRDRLMHPKKPEDMIVTDLEMQKVIRTYQWMYLEMTMNFLKSVHSHAVDRRRKRKAGTSS